MPDMATEISENDPVLLGGGTSLASGRRHTTLVIDNKTNQYITDYWS